ncbi:MAG: hypothetical protein GXP43_03565 [bacterium]|nr:hypothetical protein [bacterium]
MPKQLDLIPTQFLKPEFAPDAGGAGASSLANILTLLVSFLTLIAGLWFATQFILAGWQWMSAGSDSNKISEAQKQIVNSFIGLMIIVAAMTITKIISIITGIQMLDLAGALQKLSP